MRIPFVDLHRQHLSIKRELNEAIATVIRDSAFVRGPHVDEFESRFAELIGVEHCVSCGNGTDALYITMKSLGVGPGDEVITTAHSWISTSEAISQCGARVVFVDSEEDCYCIQTAHIEMKISPKTKGIIPVHLFGQAADMDPILEIANDHGLWVLEDCAQAHLAAYRNQRVGTLGTAATYSFYPGKNLGAMGDAGCIVTDDTDLAERCALFARHGGKGEHKIEGVNSRMDGLQAAALNVKMRHLESWTRQRQRAAELYDKLLSAVAGITCPAKRKACDHVYHLYVIQSDNRDELRNYLTEQGIATVINYPKALPFYDAYHYLRHEVSDFPVAHRYMSQILSLPMFPEITAEEIEYIATRVAEFQSKNRQVDFR